MRMKIACATLRYDTTGKTSVGAQMSSCAPSTGIPLHPAYNHLNINERGIMRISIGSDHAGFEQKEMLIGYLESQGIGIIDRGPATDARVDYPDYAALVSADVAHGQADFGILVCGTGIGMAIAANKVDGIRAVNIVREDFAALAREHNNANVLTLSGRFVPFEENCRIVDAFLATPFGGGRHEGRVAKIMALEA